MKLLFFLPAILLLSYYPSPHVNSDPRPIKSDTIVYKSFAVDRRSQDVVVCKRLYAINMRTPPLMVTNGGMFDPDYSPHGLLVVGHKVFKSLDMKKAKGANFYLQPNGVFVINDSKYSILSTQAYGRRYANASPEFATQSGPLLVIEDSINKIFEKGSEYLNTRSGVGILPSGDPVFILAENINFYDFASLFKNVFHCRNALFLDGGISAMFVGAKEEEDMLGYNFGPVISVLKK